MKLRQCIWMWVCASTLGLTAVAAEPGNPSAGSAPSRSPDLIVNATRTLRVDRRYLNLPVKNGAPPRRMSLLLHGRTVREFTIELANGRPDFWVFVDLTPFQHQDLTIRVDRLPADSSALRDINQADAIQGATNLYHETLRPQFHFTSRRGWLNDPNGLVYDHGVYHLFYQHNPYGWNWGNMHWGHAVSRDLVHWHELPIAIYPHRFGDWVFSGSAVIDRNNTAGFKSGNQDVIVAAYTSTGRGECIAYSTDQGRTFTDYTNDPVVVNRGRDPRLLWYAPRTNWVMAVYDENPTLPDKSQRRGIAFYSSPDLKHWKRQSRIGGFYECPDMFQLPVKGNPQEKKWVLTAANSDYLIGQFDGKKFTPESAKLAGQRGVGFYAAQTYSDIPPADGRRIQIGWLRSTMPGMPFNQMMAFPCSLTLVSTPAGLRLCHQPVREIRSLYGQQYQWRHLKLTPGKNPLAGIHGRLFDLRAAFAPGRAKTLRFNVRGEPVIYSVADQTLTCHGITNSLPLLDGKVHIQILVDRTSVEIFGNHGLLYMPMAITCPVHNESLTVDVTGGPALFDSLWLCKLKSIWN